VPHSVLVELDLRKIVVITAQSDGVIVSIWHLFSEPGVVEVHLVVQGEVLE
jgi:hypothetical protein